MKTPTSSIDKYRLARCRQLGLFGVYAYRCHKCLYVWLPKNVEILNPTALANRKLPKSCARCKSKSWQKPPKHVSVARIRALLGEEKRDRAIALLSMTTEKKIANVMIGLRKKYSEQYLEELLREILFVSQKKEQHLETFKDG